jgi:hypothetical protein
MAGHRVATSLREGIVEKAPENFGGTEPQEILTLAGMALYQAQILEVAGHLASLKSRCQA